MYDNIKLRVKQTSQYKSDSDEDDMFFFSTKTGVGPTGRRILVFILILNVY